MKKHNTIKTLCLAALLLFGGLRASAQLEQSIFLNGSLPLGQMRQKTLSPIMGKDSVGSNATLGLGLGYRASYHFDVGFGEIAPYLNVDLMWNQVNGDLRDQNIRNGMKSAQYINIPAMLGINYRYELTDILKPFAEFGVGYDLLFVTAEGNKGDAAQPYLKYNVRNAMAWQVGLGCYFGRHVSASLHYYGMGRHYVTYNDKSHFPPVPGITGFENPSVDNEPTPLNVGQLLLRVGFHF